MVSDFQIGYLSPNYSLNSQPFLFQVLCARSYGSPLWVNGCRWHIFWTTQSLCARLWSAGTSLVVAQCHCFVLLFCWELDWMFMSLRWASKRKSRLHAFGHWCWTVTDSGKLKRRGRRLTRWLLWNNYFALCGTCAGNFKRKRDHR